MSTEVPKHSDGAPANNQNARRHGWTSRINPAPVSAIMAAVDQAANESDLRTLRRAKRALQFRSEHGLASDVQGLIEMVEYEQRRAVNDTLYAPQRIAEEMTPPPVTSPRTRDESRIARAYRPSVPWARGLE